MFEKADDYFDERMTSYRRVIITRALKCGYFFEFSPNSIFLAVYIIDYMLEYFNYEKIKASKEELDIMLVAASNIAGKYFEVDNLFSFKNFQNEIPSLTLEIFEEMERRILTVIDFQLEIPERYTFFETFSVITELDPKYINFSTLLLYHTLLSIDFNYYKPSLLAASVCYISRKMKDLPWTDQFIEVIRSREDDMMPLVKNIQEFEKTLDKIEYYEEIYADVDLKEKFINMSF